MEKLLAFVPLTVTLPRASDALPVFVTVSVCAAACDPELAEKVMLVADKETVGAGTGEVPWTPDPPEPQPHRQAPPSTIAARSVNLTAVIFRLTFGA
jgi:hypothetical protein